MVVNFLLCKTAWLGICGYHGNVDSYFANYHLVYKNFYNGFVVIGALYFLGNLCFSFKFLYLATQLKFIFPHHTFNRLVGLSAVFGIFFLIIFYFNFPINRKIN